MLFYGVLFEGQLKKSHNVQQGEHGQSFMFKLKSKQTVPHPKTGRLMVEMLTGVELLDGHSDRVTGQLLTNYESVGPTRRTLLKIYLNVHPRSDACCMGFSCGAEESRVHHTSYHGYRNLRTRDLHVRRTSAFSAATKLIHACLKRQSISALTKR